MDPPCKFCLRDGHYGSLAGPYRLHYPIGMPNFSVAYTYERFGKAMKREPLRDSLCGSSLMVVSDTVKKVLENERGVSFEPIILE